MQVIEDPYIEVEDSNYCRKTSKYSVLVPLSSTNSDKGYVFFYNIFSLINVTFTKVCEIPSQHPKLNSSKDPQSKFPTTTLGDRQTRCIQIENNLMCSKHKFCLGVSGNRKNVKATSSYSFSFFKKDFMILGTQL